MKLLAAGCLCLASLIVPAFGEFNNSIFVDIPFTFHVGDAEMSTGQFQVSRSMTDAVVLFRALDPSSTPSNKLSAAAASVMNGLGQEDTGKQVVVVFNKYGENRYFVSEIRYSNGYVRFGKSRAERVLITTTLTASRTPERVELVARATR